MHIESFDLIRPIPLFDVAWDRGDLVQIPSDDSEVHVGDTIEFVDVSLPAPPYKVPYPKSTDIWGIHWSTLSEEGWNPHIAELGKTIAQFKVAYLRLEVTVYNGRPSDSMLFLLNQPGSPPSEGRHARVHVEIPPSPPSDEGRRCTAVEQHLLRGWPELAESADGQQALSRIRELTQVRFLGVSLEERLRVQACATLIGGFR